MRTYSMIFSTFWTGRTGREIKKMGPEAQILALYLLTSPSAMSNMGIGIYYLPIDYMVHDIGAPSKGLTKALGSLSEGGFCAYDPLFEYVWVKEMAKFQIGSLKPNDNRVAGVKKALMNIPENLCFLYDFYQKYKKDLHLEDEAKLVAPSKPLGSPFEAMNMNMNMNMNKKPPPIAPPLKKNPESKIDREGVREVLDHLNAVAGTNHGATEAHVKFINARLAEGHTVEQCKAVIDQQAELWRDQEGMWQYMRPATLFNASKFSSYVGMLGSKQPAKKTLLEELIEEQKALQENKTENENETG